MQEIVLDTTVLRRADVELINARDRARLMSRRLQLLKRIRAKELIVLISARLVAEYVAQVKPGKNDFVKAFLELVTSPDGTYVVQNWAQWSGASRAKARACRFPAEDDHILRTACRDTPTWIVSEEDRMIKTNDCIYKAFRVRIGRP